MRAVCVYVSMISASLLTTVAANSATPVNTPGSSVKVIQGLSNAQHFQAPSNGQFYVQAGTFRSAKNAETYKNQLAEKFHHPVRVKTQGNSHMVLIGPINSAAEVRRLGGGAEVRSVPVEQPVVGSPNRFEVLGALGIANLRADNSRLGVTSFEIDTLVPNNNKWNTFAAQLGVGYVYYFGDAQRHSDEVQWFPSIEPQVNGYYLDGNSSIQGEVWRFESSEFNGLSFKSSVQSTRLMFDTALTIVSRQYYSLYVIGGIGNAWNRLSYKDSDNEDGSCSIGNLNLNSRTHSNFAWEAGGGLMYSYNDRVALTLQYLYTDLGEAGSSASGTFGSISLPVIVPPRFDLSAQTVSLGIHVAV
ncbi:SPOR domain-containing protein [Legionella jamestowniensis]|uniref:Rare lipoprotein A n=1 Tax=Legionella jamestowniensis TaxID=455 RepID=A0A0W0UNA5_9GAMM|nr:SPOR domain-containing protein [Legionella jamestowniensis]KTD09354.1 rare lipoprotein A [Legionella jamestowniensis]SFL87993.1 Sporulation related domain-containing protein [Legionella jamestowniensis DSM 19215]